MEFVQRIAVGCPGWCVHRKEWGGTNHLSNVCVYFYLASARHITTLSNLCIVSPSQHDGNQCKGTGDPIAEWKQRERTDSKLFVVSSWDSFGTLFSDLHCENNIELNIHVESPVILKCSRFLWLTLNLEKAMKAIALGWTLRISLLCGNLTEFRALNRSTWVFHADPSWGLTTEKNYIKHPWSTPEFQPLETKAE